MHFPKQPIDQFDISPLTKADVQVFNAISTNWQTWTKPKGATMSFMFAVGGGGGGGGGQSGGNGGGGGGACSAISRLIISAFFLPENLFVQVGLGGIGGQPSGSGTAGSAGGISYISLGRTTATPNVILASNGANAAGGGAAGNTATGGTASNAFGGSTFTSGLGIFAATAYATNAANGGTSGGGSSVIPWQTASSSNFVLSPGAGGCGRTTAGTNGGAQNNGTNALDLSFLGLVATSTAILNGGVTAAAGGAGPNGIKRLTPFMQTGGCGGGYATTSTGGQGGDGGYGCGGGGGAAGQTTAAAGGNGGDGLVMIISW